MDSKPFYQSKVFWVNLIAAIGMIYQGATGNVLMNLELQASILAGINMILRFVTKGKITLS